jgi:hypothetical protein
MFGKLLTKFINPEKLLRQGLTVATPMLAKPLLVEFFNGRMNAASRIKLGEHLVDAGNALKAGKVADASEELAEVLGEIKL